VAEGAVLEIGDDVLLNQGVNIYVSSRVTIGSHSKLADLVAIYDTDFHEVEPGADIRRAPVVLGENVWLGRGVLVLPGVTIGDHSVVAAGSVVLDDVPPNTLVAGTPAKVVRALSVPDGFIRQ
jgi:acetyltransferase-like isoleucine patch superfamily enzyme